MLAAPKTPFRGRLNSILYAPSREKDCETYDDWLESLGVPLLAAQSFIKRDCLRLTRLCARVFGTVDIGTTGVGDMFAFECYLDNKGERSSLEGLATFMEVCSWQQAIHTLSGACVCVPEYECAQTCNVMPTSITNGLRTWCVGYAYVQRAIVSPVLHQSCCPV